MFKFGIMKTMFAGGMAGVANWCFAIPQDVLKSRLQVRIPLSSIRNSDFWLKRSYLQLLCIWCKYLLIADLKTLSHDYFLQPTKYGKTNAMNAITIFCYNLNCCFCHTSNKCPSQKLLFIHSVYWTHVGFSKYDKKYPSFTYFTIPIFALDIRIIFCSFTKAVS